MKFSPMRTYTYKMKHIRTIFPLILALLLGGCVDELSFKGPQHGEESGDSVCISLKAAVDVNTKATGSGKGDAMNNVHIWIADSEGKISYNGSYSANYNDRDKSFVFADGNKTATAEFINVERGDYKLYVVANLPASLSELTSKTSVDDEFLNAVLPGLDGNKPPFTDDNGMPMSLVKDISVGPGVTEVEAELVRVCGRVRVTIRNMTTDKNIFLQSLKLTDKNPSTGYLFHKEDHGTPADITFGEFSSFELTGTETDDFVAPGDEKTYIDQFLYETGLTGMGTLGFEIVGGIYNEGTTNVEIVETTTSTKYTEGLAITSGYNTSTEYMIVNAAANYYLYNDAGSPKLKILTDGDKSAMINSGTEISNYIWKFTSSGTSTVIQNVNNGYYLYIEGNNKVSLTNDSHTVTIIDGFKFYSGEYYMQSDNDVLTAKKNQDTPYQSWKLIPVDKESTLEKNLKDPLKDFNKSNSSITYIDQYGLPVTLEHICRNDDVNIVINIFYSPESGVLYFEVEDWSDVKNDTTFD